MQIWLTWWRHCPNTISRWQVQGCMAEEGTWSSPVQPRRLDAETKRASWQARLRISLDRAWDGMGSYSNDIDLSLGEAFRRPFDVRSTPARRFARLLPTRFRDLKVFIGRDLRGNLSFSVASNMTRKVCLPPDRVLVEGELLFSRVATHPGNLGSLGKVREFQASGKSQGK